MPSPAVEPDVGSPSHGDTSPLKVLFFLDYEDPLGGSFANSPGLLPLIGLTRAHGFDIDFVGSEAVLLGRLRSEKIDVVAVSSMERLLPRTAEVACRVREIRPDVVMMIGGNALDPFAADLAASLFDVVVLGEAEYVFPALLEAVEAGLRGERVADSSIPLIEGQTVRLCDADDAPGCSALVARNMLSAAFTREVAPGLLSRVRIGGAFVRHDGTVWRLDPPRLGDALAVVPHSDAIMSLELGSAPLACELDEMCVEPWDIFKREGWTHFEFYAQRGCRWGRCSFCSVSDREIRAQSPAKVIEVIRQAVEHGAELVSFADDLFIQNREWTRAVLDDLAKAGFQGVEMRAQTMATASVWPMLEAMKAAGFAELAFGVETLSAERAEFMVKTMNGKKYVANAMETVLRTAQAGINPVLYIIMVDPRSTLHEIVEELVDTVTLCRNVFKASGILPKISYSLMMLPVASTVITDRFPYNTEDVSLGSRTVAMPSEFKVDRAVSRYLAGISLRTDSMPKRRENLDALHHYLAEAADIAEEFDLPDAAYTRELVHSGISELAELTAEIDKEIDATAQSIALYMSGEAEHAAAMARLDHRWLGGYVRGIERFFNSIRQIETA